jgi:hypothetical protein
MLLTLLQSGTGSKSSDRTNFKPDIVASFLKKHRNHYQEIKYRCFDREKAATPHTRKPIFAARDWKKHRTLT